MKTQLTIFIRLLSTSVKIKDSLLVEKSEIKLASKLVDYKKIITPLIDNRNYKSALTELAGLRAEDDSTTSSTISSIDDYSLLAPYATSNDQTFFAFEAANSDGISHIKTLGNNIFGLEDLYGGGDLDYDDIVVRLDFSVG